jgi:hypothetical protein
LTRSRIYYLASTLDKRERLFLPRIATAIITATTILQTLTSLQPVKAAEVTAEAEAQIGAEGEPIGAPELAITAGK